MTRPLRFEFPGALYHVTARGNRRNIIFVDSIDRSFWLRMLETVSAQRRLRIFAYCQMGNHYHLLVETAQANLASSIRDLNSRYAQWFNQRHEYVGHLFQGRYHAILVQKETYLLELARYIVLNPVRAGLVQTVDAWPWSSYAATVSQTHRSDWLDTDAVLLLFGSDPRDAVHAYVRYVAAGVQQLSPMRAVRFQSVLGDEQFIERYCRPQIQTEISRAQRRAMAVPLSRIRAQSTNLNDAIQRAHSTGAYTMRMIADSFGVSSRTVGRIIGNQRRQPKP